MLHKETLEAYRRMTPSERLTLTLEMMRVNAHRMFEGDPELVDRRFAAIEKQNIDRNRRMLTAISKASARHG